MHEHLFHFEIMHFAYVNSVRILLRVATMASEKANSGVTREPEKL